MSTPPAPAKLAVVVATAAPIAVIIRRGPSHWSQLIKWNLEKDEFEPGQWLKGKVDYASLSPNGDHIAMGIMGGRSRIGSWEDTQYTLVSRVPYFTALAIRFRPLVMNGVDFTIDGKLVWGRGIEFRAENACPYELGASWSFEEVDDLEPFQYHCNYKSTSWKRAVGRSVEIVDGRLIELKDDGEQVLFDANLYQPCEVETPDWALRW